MNCGYPRRITTAQIREGELLRKECTPAQLLEREKRRHCATPCKITPILRRDAGKHECRVDANLKDTGRAIAPVGSIREARPGRGGGSNNHSSLDLVRVLDGWTGAYPAANPSCNRRVHLSLPHRPAAHRREQQSAAAVSTCRAAEGHGCGCGQVGRRAAGSRTMRAARNGHGSCTPGRLARGAPGIT